MSTMREGLALKCESHNPLFFFLPGPVRVCGSIPFRFPFSPLFLFFCSFSSSASSSSSLLRLLFLTPFSTSSAVLTLSPLHLLLLFSPFPLPFLFLRSSPPLPPRLFLPSLSPISLLLSFSPFLLPLLIFLLLLFHSRFLPLWSPPPVLFSVFFSYRFLFLFIFFLFNPSSSSSLLLLLFPFLLLPSTFLMFLTSSCPFPLLFLCSSSVLPLISCAHRIEPFNLQTNRRQHRRVGTEGSGESFRAARNHSTVSCAMPNLRIGFLQIKAALQNCALDKTPGVDKIPYRALCPDIPWWQEAILQFLDLCRSYGCIPSMWKHGIVVPMAKKLNASDRDEYRPITLTSCFAKTLERNILNCIKPVIDPQLDSSQAGFPCGADVQAYALLETLRLRQGSRTFVHFFTVEKLSMLLGVMVPY